MGSTKSSDRPLALLSSMGYRLILLAVALGAVILGGFTLVWFAVDGARARRARRRRQPRPKTRRQLNPPISPPPPKPGGGAKERVRELTEAQQQPAHAIAAIEAEQESNRAARILVLRPRCAVVQARSGPEPWGVVPLPRRPASPRPTLR